MLSKNSINPKAWKVTLLMTLAFAVMTPPTVLAQGTLYVENNRVGVGVATPAVPMHVQVNDGGFPDLFRVENIGGTFAGFRFSTQDGNIDFNNANGNRFRLNMDDGDSWELQLDAAGNLSLPQGTIFTTGSCNMGCDMVFSEEYDLPTIEEHAEEMWRNNFLPTVGPTRPDEPFDLTDKTQRMLNELEKAHIYIDQLNSRLNDKDETISDLEARLARIELVLQEQK